MLERHTISSGISKLFFSHGDIFDQEYGFDGIVVFIPPTIGLSLHSDCEYFKRNLDPYKHSNKIFLWEYNWRNQPPIISHEIKHYVNVGLDAMKEYKCKHIGFHGVRTYDIDEFECETMTIQCVCDWVKQNGDSINSITLVDAKGGYNFHAI